MIRRTFAAAFIATLVALGAATEAQITIKPAGAMGGGTLPITAFPLLAPDGTAGVPSYAFANNSNTGLSHSGTGGSSIIRFNVNGTTAVQMDSASGLYIGATGGVNFVGRGGFAAPADGVLFLRNNSTTDFNRLQFGGTTNAFPSLQRSGASFKVRVADDTGYGGLYAAFYNIAGLSSISAASDGVITLQDIAGTSFGRMNFGGTTSAFPALKRSASGLHVRLADDSNYGALTAATLTSNGNVFACSTCGFIFSGTAAILSSTGTPEGVVTANTGSLFLRTDGAANTTLYIKQTGTGNTGWFAVTP